MPISPMDEYLAHQTSETFDHVATSDRNFYDRFYFNCHPSSDELFLITGLGQYPNLGVTDAFVSVAHGTSHYVVRASRELGSDRLDTSVGPLRVEIHEGLMRLRVICEPNEWGVAFDMVFTGSVPAIEEPKTYRRQYGRVMSDVSRFAQVGVWEGELEVAGQQYSVTPDSWKGARDRSWGVRPVGEAEPPGIRTKDFLQGTHGFFHQWLPMQFDDFVIKVQFDELFDGTRTQEESVKVHNLGSDAPDEHMGRPEIDITYVPGTREIEHAVLTLTKPDGEVRTVTSTPLRTLYLKAGTGYMPHEGWGHGFYQGPLEVEGHTFDVSTPEARAEWSGLNETLARFELDTGEVGYGLHENMVVGTYLPHGFDSFDAVAPARARRARLSTTSLLAVALLGVAVGWVVYLNVTTTGGRIGALGLGLLGSGVGGGIALPYASKVGLQVTTIVAWLVLLGGLALVVTAAIGLARRFRGWARLGVVIGVVTAAYVVLSAVGLAVAATNVPRVELGDADPAAVGLDARDVTFRATDGVGLAGWYVPTTNGDAVVLLHGAGSTRSSVLNHAVVLARAGYGVLLFDARGHGESDGRAMDFGWYGDRDVDGAVRFLAEQPEVANGRILAVGLSMGGEEAIGAAATNTRICGVVAEGATNRTAADRSWLSGSYGVRGFAQEGLDRLTYGFVDLLTATSPPVSLRTAVAEMAPRRVLLIAARRVADEPKAAAHIKGGSPRTVEVWVAPGAGHTGALEARQSEWTERVVGFLDQAPC